MSPLYVYTCEKCGNTIELRRPMANRYELIYCESERCGDTLQPMEFTPSAPAGIIVRGGITNG